MTTNAQIRGLPFSHELRELLVKINDATATAVDINASNISLAEKRVCTLLLASPARPAITGETVDGPVQKIAMSIAALAEAFKSTALTRVGAVASARGMTNTTGLSQVVGTGAAGTMTDAVT